MHSIIRFKLFFFVLLVAILPYPASAQDTPVKIGNPTLARWPASGDPANARRRSMWDMHHFNGRIYIGSGDYWDNSGPTDVWTYDGNSFIKEYTVDDEMIFDFFEFENKLFIPGNDATEDWSFENIYINDPNRVPNPGWIKLRTLPGGLHSFDVALFKGELYASIFTDGSTPAKTLVSTDMGQTWTTFISEYSSFVVFDDFMFIAGNNYYKYDGNTLQTITLNLFDYRNMNRQAKFQDGVLYTNPGRYVLYNTPLYFLPSSEIKDGGTATKIAKFATDNVQDIVVRNTICYVMTAEEITQDVAYKGRIYSSTDLTHWSLAADFIVPGIPLSFEIMNNKFYVGLGSRFEPSLGSCVGPESGSIWEIITCRADLNLNGTVNFTDYALFANNWMDNTCCAPNWCEGTDFDHSGSVDTLDLMTFAKYWLIVWCQADLDLDGAVNFTDYAIFAHNWMDDTCCVPNWCEGADFNHSGRVDIIDLATFAEKWIK